MSAQKTIVLAISGSIAAYKSCELVRSLSQKENYSVHVIMTPNAERFVGKVSLQALSGQRVFSSEWEEGMLHIDMKKLADIYVVAPATANAIAKFANGIADDIVSSAYLAMACPVVLAPAMNPTMYAAPAVQRNLTLLQQDGVHIIAPTQGEVICGDTGQGKMAAVTTIVSEIQNLLS